MKYGIEQAADNKRGRWLRRRREPGGHQRPSSNITHGDALQMVRTSAAAFVPDIQQFHNDDVLDCVQFGIGDLQSGGDLGQQLHHRLPHHDRYHELSKCADH